MAINFSLGTNIAATASGINIPGSIIQFVDKTETVGGAATTASWVNSISNSITISNPANQILVEYMMDERSDQGNGTWSLIYHRVLCNGAQVMHGGHNGSAANHIGFYERTFLYTPGSAGTFTFQGQILPHQGTCYFGTGNNQGNTHYLRLYEIGR